MDPHGYGMDLHGSGMDSHGDAALEATNRISIMALGGATLSNPCQINAVPCLQEFCLLRSHVAYADSRARGAGQAARDEASVTT